MRRRDVLCWLGGTAAVPLTGCMGSFPAAGDPTNDGPSTPATADRSCDAFVHRGPTPTATAPLPWDLEINRIGLPSLPVTIEVTDRSAEPPTTVARCTARTEAQERLSFGLDPDTVYRFGAVLHRREGPSTASMTLAGRELAPNSMLEVTSTEDAGFTIRQTHYDVPETEAG